MLKQVTIERIKQLEVLARGLEPEPEARQALLGKVARYSEDFLQGNERAPAYNPKPGDGIGLLDYPFKEEPGDIDSALMQLKEHVDTVGINPASGRHLGYIPGGGIYHSALADYLVDVSNRYAGMFFPSPGAVRMENMVLDWMAQIVGYPASAAGNLTSGGSIAHLAAIVTAREAFGLRAKDFEKAVVYLTGHSHHSVAKALRIAGLGECQQREVPVDAEYRLRPECLDQLINDDNQAGLVPWMVVATAGTTNTGAVDPLEAINQVARAHGLWYHVDGAYGGFFILCDQGKRVLKGMALSDSLIMDPHKTLFVPYGTGALLVRDGGKLLQANACNASYLQDASRLSDELSPSDLSPELTKHFRGLRLWLPLQLAGIAAFRAALEEKILLAQYAYQCLEQMPGFELGPYPQLSIVTFRYRPASGSSDAFNEALVREVQQDGRIFVSSTRLNGKYVIRLAVASFRTHLAEIEQAIDILRVRTSQLR